MKQLCRLQWNAAASSRRLHVNLLLIQKSLRQKLWQTGLRKSSSGPPKQFDDDKDYDPVTAKKIADEDLNWGACAGRQERLMLEPPSLPNSPVDIRSVTGGMRGYLTARGWAQTVAHDQSNPLGPPAFRFISHLLTYPLTTAWIISQLPETVLLQESVALLCLGARAEAALPAAFWRELLVALPPPPPPPSGGGGRRRAPRPQRVTLDMVGPDLPAAGAGGRRRPPLRAEYSYKNAHGMVVSRFLEITQRHGTLHAEDNSNLTSMDNYDAVIMFNPGIGNSGLKEGWAPTLSFLFHGPLKPKTGALALTSLSAEDQAIDSALLEEIYLPRRSPPPPPGGRPLGAAAAAKAAAAADSYLTRPGRNPFASGRPFLDPKNEGHVVRANWGVAIAPLVPPWPPA